MAIYLSPPWRWLSCITYWWSFRS